MGESFPSASATTTDGKDGLARFGAVQVGRDQFSRVAIVQLRQSAPEDKGS
jgi:hypothetical protein